MLYYLLCIGQKDTVCPLSWRIAEPRYDDILSNIGLIILQYVLGQHVLCIDHRNMHVGAIWYWHGVIRALNARGYRVYSIVAPDRATDPIDFTKAHPITHQNMHGNFVEKLASVVNYCFLLSK